MRARAAALSARGARVEIAARRRRSGVELTAVLDRLGGAGGERGAGRGGGDARRGACCASSWRTSCLSMSRRSCSAPPPAPWSSCRSLPTLKDALPALRFLEAHAAWARTCGCACGPRRSAPLEGTAVFTGIVQDVGRVEQPWRARGGDVRLRRSPASSSTSRACTSVTASAVQGCCLTATEIERRSFAADVSRETLALTTLADFRAGTRGESRAGAARRRCARRAPGVRPRRWGGAGTEL